MQSMSLVGGLEGCDAATSRSSAKRVASVVSKFDEHKRKLVCDIGFEGILHIPQINKTPRKFTVWLLSKIDFPTKSIVVEGKCNVELSDMAFRRVLGIPCGPKKLVGLETTELQEKMDFIKLAVGSICTDPSETCTLKVAEDVVTMEYRDGMGIEEASRFKVAFVVFVVGHFLVANTRTNHGMEEYWGSLLNTNEIHLHNFCSLVIHEILDSARKVQDELKYNRTIKNVTGCTLGLQILYLDILKMSQFSMPPEKFPRIALFDLVLLKKMINADQERSNSASPSDGSANVSTTESTGHNRLHYGRYSNLGNMARQKVGKSVFYTTPQPAVSTYLTAYLNGTLEQKLSYGQVDALKWHNARMIYHVRKTKQDLFEGGGFASNNDGFNSIVEVHMEALMANIFQDNLSLAQRLHFHASALCTPSEDTIKGSSSFNASSAGYNNMSKNQCLMGGRSVHDSNSLKRTSSVAATVQTPIVGKRLFQADNTPSDKRIKQESDNSRTERVTKYDHVKKQSQPFIYSEDEISAIIEHGSGVGLDTGLFTSMPSVVRKLNCKQKRMAPNPWKIGAPRKIVTDYVTNCLYGWLQDNNLSTLRSNWVEHSLPKYVELDGYTLKDIFINNKQFTPEAFDIGIRRIVQLDSLMYGAGSKLCWRHILESDFATMVLSNMDPLECVSVIYQFTMMFNDYDISECRMIVIPAYVNLTWCAYYWDMEESKVHVIDPTYEISKAQSLEDMHIKNVVKIQASLTRIICLLFDGWNVNWSAFRTHFLKPIVPAGNRGRNGLVTLLSIQEFDGSHFVESQTEETIDAFNKLVLYEMVSLEGNYGKRPSAFIESIM